MRKKIISIVIPTHNEEQNIEFLYFNIIEAFKPLKNYHYEIIFCDDSDDKTSAIINSIIKKDANVNLVKFTRSFGQCIAISAGIDFSNGDAIIIMDADLQDPPSILKKIINLWEKGNDVVVVTRKSEKKSFFYFYLAKLFYKIQHSISSITIPKNAGEFRLIDKKVANFLRTLPERSRYIRGLTMWPGFKHTTIEIERLERYSGKSNYNLIKAFENALDGLFSFSVVPLRISLVIGVFMFILSSLGIIYGLVRRVFFDDWVSGWSITFVSMMLISALQFIMIGILSEYISRVYTEVLNRPLYVVSYINGKVKKNATK